MYGSTIAVAFGGSAIGLATRNRRMFLVQILLFLLLVYQMGFRWKMGTDWIPYERYFDEVSTVADVVVYASRGYEIGYGFLTLVSRSLSSEYTFFLSLHAALFYSLVFVSVNRISPQPLITILLLYVILIGYTGANRQLIALGFCFLSLPYSLKRKVVPFAICIALASLFHTTALIFSIYYLLNRDISSKTAVTFLVVAGLIGTTGLPTLVFNLLGQYVGGIFLFKVNYYLETNQAGGETLSLIGALRRMLVFTVATIMYKQAVKVDPVYRLAFNGYLIGLLIYLSFSNSLLALVNRGSMYFNSMEALIFPVLVATQVKAGGRLAAMVLLLLYAILLFFQNTNNHSQLFFPYQSLHVNFDYYRPLW